VHDPVEDVVATIAADRWVSRVTQTVAPVEITRDGFTIGSKTFPIASRLMLEGHRLDIIYDGWRLDSFWRYRPLIYYAAFGQDEVFGCLRIAIESLFEFGDYDGDVLLITDHTHATWPATLPEPWRGRVHVRTLPDGDLLAWTLAR
jgi:hypothetical protein